MLKKVLLVLLAVFVLYWLIQAPNSFATFAQETASWLWRMIRSIFESLINVLNSLGS